MQTEHQALPRETERIAREVIDAAFAVHRTLGPGLLESVYEICLAHELTKRGHGVAKQAALPVVYDAIKLEAGFRIDLIVDEVLIVEVKAVEAIASVHEAQLLTYMRLSNRRLGLLINFNTALLKQGIRRMIL